MRRILVYSSFIIGCLAVIVAFTTSTTYTQLGIAILLYLPLTYFAFKIFAGSFRGGGNPKKSLITIQVPAKPHEEVPKVKQDQVYVADVDKRTFLKLIGATGLSFFLFSLLGRRVDSLLFGNGSGSNTNSIGTVDPGNQADQAGVLPAEYKITDIDDNIVSYYGFTKRDGEWLIMRQDTQTNSFRYAKGDSGFSQNWTRREKLQYDYYYKLF